MARKNVRGDDESPSTSCFKPQLKAKLPSTWVRITISVKTRVLTSGRTFFGAAQSVSGFLLTLLLLDELRAFGAQGEVLARFFVQPLAVVVIEHGVADQPPGDLGPEVILG